MTGKDKADPFDPAYWDKWVRVFEEMTDGSASKKKKAETPFAKDARQWRAERDQRDPLKPLPTLPRPITCPDCTPGPCRYPTLCTAAYVAQNNDRTLGGKLPDGWWNMGEEQLGRLIDEKHEAERLARAAKGPNRAERRAENAEREQLRKRWPEEFRDGAQCGYSGEYPGERLKGGYPVGFHFWPLERRNAWYAGFNQGYHDRKGKKGNDNAG